MQRGQECHAPRPSRRLVLVPQSADATPQSIQDRQWERDAGAESHNRFSPLQDTEIDAQEADLIPVPGSVVFPVPQSEPAPTQWANGPEFVRRGPDFDSESREGFRAGLCMQALAAEDPPTSLPVQEVR